MKSAVGERMAKELKLEELLLLLDKAKEVELENVELEADLLVLELPSPTKQGGKGG